MHRCLQPIDERRLQTDGDQPRQLLTSPGTKPEAAEVAQLLHQPHRMTRHAVVHTVRQRAPHQQLAAARQPKIGSLRLDRRNDERDAIDP